MVESLPWYRLAYLAFECLVAVAECFVGQEQHGYVEFQAEALTQRCEAIKAVGIASAKVYGHHVAMSFNALLYECLVPRQVVNDAVLSARAQFCRKHDDVVIAFEGRIDLHRQVATLLARHIYRHAQWRQPVQVHEQIVYQIAYTPIVAVAQYLAYGYAVGPAKGVVAHKGKTASVGVVGQIVIAFDVEFVVQKRHHGIKPRNALSVAHAIPKTVAFVLMHDVL